MADKDAAATDVNADEAQDLGEAMLDAEESTSSEDSSTEANEDDSTEADQSTDGDDDNPSDDDDGSSDDTEGDDSEEDDDKDDKKSEDDDSEEDNANDTTDDDKGKPKTAEARKAELNNEIREMVSTKNKLRDEIATLNSQKYRTQTETELVETGMDPADAKVEAAEQKQRLSEYNNAVADLNSTLEIEALQVYNDFPVFDPKSPDYDEKFEKMARTAYTKAAAPQQDEQTGLVNRVNVLPYEFYSAFAEGFNYGRSKGQVSGQKATEKMIAAAEPRGSTPSKRASDEEKDPFMEGFDRVK